MRKLSAILAVILLAALAFAAPASAAPKPAAAEGCDYAYALKAANSGQLVWDGGNGERVTLTIYVQEAVPAIGSGCSLRLRTAGTFRCFKNGLAANCGATGWSLLSHRCSIDWCWYGDETPYNVGSSGPDGVFSVYEAWKDGNNCIDYRGAVQIGSVSVAGYTSNSDQWKSSATYNRCATLQSRSLSSTGLAILAAVIAPKPWPGIPPGTWCIKAPCP
jgi:hypothetical protein